MQFKQFSLNQKKENKEYDNPTLTKINRVAAFAACSPSCPARVRLLWRFCHKCKQLSPAPDGCYPNFTTAEGCNALKFLTTGAGNTAPLVGVRSLPIPTPSSNTGVGGGALALNNGESNTAVGVTAALLLNTSGTTRTPPLELDAMVHNDGGSNNNAVGNFALF